MQEANVAIAYPVVYFQAESKKEEFRKYLESAGVLDALTKGLLLLCATMQMHL